MGQLRRGGLLVVADSLPRHGQGIQSEINRPVNDAAPLNCMGGAREENPT
jgi:hypothetical protein